MAPSDIPKTAIATSFGLFEFQRMPFGLRNAAQCFQQMMDEITTALPAVKVYLEDVLIASKDSATHIRDLRLLFRTL